jgi:hypothetical protein
MSVVSIRVQAEPRQRGDGETSGGECLELARLMSNPHAARILRSAADRVRITAQLNDVATGSHIWAERYDRGLADVFAVQDEITEAIVAAIGGPGPSSFSISLWLRQLLHQVAQLFSCVRGTGTAATGYACYAEEWIRCCRSDCRRASVTLRAGRMVSPCRHRSTPQHEPGGSQTR